MINLPKGKELILFDGVCNLCNNSVTLVIKRDASERFMFAPLQGEAGKKIIEAYNIDTSKTDSILLYSPERGVTYKSTAAIRIARYLGLPYALLSVFYIIPPFIRNWFYDYIAKNRYKWYGKRDACMIPTPELKAKFLD